MCLLQLTLVTAAQAYLSVDSSDFYLQLDLVSNDTNFNNTHPRLQASSSEIVRLTVSDLFRPVQSTINRCPEGCQHYMHADCVAFSTCILLHHNGHAPDKNCMNTLQHADVKHCFWLYHSQEQSCTV